MSVPVSPTGANVVLISARSSSPSTPSGKITKTIQAVEPATTSAMTTMTAEPIGVHPMWMYASGVLGLAILVLGITSYLQNRQLERQLKAERQKVNELQQQVKVRGEKIVKMEKNPDLVNSRDFNLDYLRMRMAEEVFHYEIVNQVKNKVRDKISIALRPKQVSEGQLGIPSTSGRQIDEVFDVEYKTDQLGTKRTLFRIGIKLVKLPTQPTSATIGQLVDCIETFLSPGQKSISWQPTIQGRLANLHWDQKAKPTPLLLIEQTQEGTNVTFRTQRASWPKTEDSPFPPKGR